MFEGDGMIDGSIDAGLYVLSLITPRGIELGREEIAEVCGCNQSYIRAVEQKAMAKLKRKFRHDPRIRQFIQKLED